jgi:hypothetical protein
MIVALAPVHAAGDMWPGEAECATVAALVIRPLVVERCVSYLARRFMRISQNGTLGLVTVADVVFLFAS